MDPNGLPVDRQDIPGDASEERSANALVVVGRYAGALIKNTDIKSSRTARRNVFAPVLWATTSSRWALQRLLAYYATHITIIEPALCSDCCSGQFHKQTLWVEEDDVLFSAAFLLSALNSSAHDNQVSSYSSAGGESLSW